MTYVGVDVGGTKIQARLIDPETGRARGRAKATTPRTNPSDILDAVVDVVGSLSGASDSVAIGLGMPGLVIDHAVVGPCPNLQGWSEPVDVGAALSKALEKPVVVANDVNCGVLAEHRFGVGKGLSDLLAVFVGTGVGGGLVLDGTLTTGTRGMAGEIGHVTVYPGGRPCGCGGFGHLEAYAGRAGIEREARARVAAGGSSKLVDLASTGTVKSRHILRALNEGDALTDELLDDAAEALAIAIGNVATFLDIGTVVLGGGVVDKLGDELVDRIRASKQFGGFGSTTCELLTAARIDDAGAVGAAIAAHDLR